MIKPRDFILALCQSMACTCLALPVAHAGFISGSGGVSIGTSLTNSGFPTPPGLNASAGGAIPPNYTASVAGTLQNGPIEMTPSASISTTFSPNFVGIIPRGGMEVSGSPQLDPEGVPRSNNSYLSINSDIYWHYAGPFLPGYGYFSEPLNGYTKVAVSVTLAAGDIAQLVVNHHISRATGGLVYAYNQVRYAAGPGTFAFDFDDTQTYSSGGIADLRQTFGLDIQIRKGGTGVSSFEVRKSSAGTANLAVPEPTTLSLALLGSCGVASIARRRQVTDRRLLHASGE